MNLTDLDAERGVLGGIMLHGNLLRTALADGLTPQCFSSPASAATFAAMVRVGTDALMAQPCGALHDELTRAGELALLGPNGRELVTLLMEALPPRLLATAWQRLVVLAAARKVQAALREAQAAVVRDPAGAPEVLARLAGAQ